jgi:hypothetical protein
MIDRDTFGRPSARPSRRVSRDHLVLAVSLVMLALSLRVGLGGLGGLIPTVQDGLRLSGTQASVLTALPSLCFALAGLAAGRVILRFGVHQVVVAVSLASVVGLLLPVEPSGKPTPHLRPNPHAPPGSPDPCRQVRLAPKRPENGSPVALRSVSAWPPISSRDGPG